MVEVIVEICRNSAVKYEIKDNKLYVDRILHTPVVYPYNYGYIPNTLAGDGDPLDAMIIMDSVLIPGSIINCRIIGVLITEDEKGMDEKIIVVPETHIDPDMSHVSDIKDLNRSILDKINFFFSNYKKLEIHKWVKVHGFKNNEEATAIFLNTKL
tara:strand:+ start:33 stop:497 length:465 start_codon:yes stop_codon:yes gene_type:complete